MNLTNLTSDKNNTKKLKGVLEKIISVEFGNMYSVCYYPKVAKYYKDLLDAVNISDHQLDEMTAEVQEKTKFNVKMLNDKITLLLGVIFFEYTRAKNKEMAMLVVKTLVLKFYGTLMSKYVKYCDEMKMSQAVNGLSKLSIFYDKRKKRFDIPGGLMDLSEGIYRRYGGSPFSDKNFILFVYGVRHRVSQSIKAVSKRYYAEMTSVEKKSESSHGDKRLFIGSVLSKMTLTPVDRNVLRAAIKNNKYVRKDVCESLLRHLMKNTGDVEVFYNRTVSLVGVDGMQKDSSYILLRKMMSAKNITKQHAHLKDIVDKIFVGLVKSAGLDSIYKMSSVVIQSYRIMIFDYLYLYALSIMGVYK